MNFKKRKKSKSGKANSNQQLLCGVYDGFTYYLQLTGRQYDPLEGSGRRYDPLKDYFKVDQGEYNEVD